MKKVERTEFHKAEVFNDSSKPTRSWVRWLIFLVSVMVLLIIGFVVGYLWPDSYIQTERTSKNAGETGSETAISISIPEWVESNETIHGGFALEVPWDFQMSFMDDYAGSDMTAGNVPNYMYEMDIDHGSGFTIWSKDSLTPSDNSDFLEHYTKINDVQARDVVGVLYKYTGSLPLNDVSTFSPDNVFMSYCYFGAQYLLVFPASGRSVQVSMCGDVDKLTKIFSTFELI